MIMNLFEEFKARGMIAQCTNEEEVAKRFAGEPMTFYIGFDPTADSLHVGHFVQVMVMAHMQRAGHIPIALFGGGTGLTLQPIGFLVINAAGEVEMLNVGVKNPSDPIEQIADIIERSPEIIARVKALLGKDKTEE